MDVRIFNADRGTIDQSPITHPEIAKDLARCLIEMESSGVYRAQLVDPLAGDRVLWDSDGGEVRRCTCEYSGAIGTQHATWCGSASKVLA